MRRDDDVMRVLRADGVRDVDGMDGLVNRPLTSWTALRAMLGDSWARRVVLNERFGAVLICQPPGDGNRLHYHPDADEFWVVLEGEYEWEIDGTKRSIKAGDLVWVRRGGCHRITAVGDGPATRLAVTAPNVEHVYAD